MVVDLRLPAADSRPYRHDLRAAGFYPRAADSRPYGKRVRFSIEKRYVPAILAANAKHRRGDGPSGGVVLPYFTVSLTALVYTLPALFFTRHLYLYPFHFLAALKEYEAFVALLIFSHFLAPGFSRYH